MTKKKKSPIADRPRTCAHIGGHKRKLAEVRRERDAACAEVARLFGEVLKLRRGLERLRARYRQAVGVATDVHRMRSEVEAVLAAYVDDPGSSVLEHRTPPASAPVPIMTNAELLAALDELAK